MHILVLASTYPRWRKDTMPLFVHQLNTELSRQYSVHVLAPHSAGALAHEMLDGVAVHRFRYAPVAWEKLAYGAGMPANIKKNPFLLLLLPFYFLSMFVLACRLIRRYRVALIHAHWIIPQGIVAVMLGWFFRQLPIVFTCHGSDIYSFNGRLGIWLKRFLLQRAQAVTVVSSFLASRLKALSLDVNPVWAPMGVDLHHQFVCSEPIHARRDLIFVGRLVDWKGCDVALQAFANVHQMHPEMRFTIVGDGSERAALMQLAQALGIDQQVDFLGARPNSQIPNLLNQHAIALVPSLIMQNGQQEGLGLTAIEAMGCGCALIASDYPAVHDMVDDGVNGLLFSAGDVESLASNILKLIEDDNRRIVLAERAQRSVAQRFDWPVCAARYEQLFDALLTTERSR